MIISLTGTSNVHCRKQSGGICSSPRGISASVRAAIDRSFGVTFPSRNNPPLYLSLSFLPFSDRTSNRFMVALSCKKLAPWSRHPNDHSLTLHLNELGIDILCMKVMWISLFEGKHLCKLLIPRNEFMSWRLRPPPPSQTRQDSERGENGHVCLQFTTWASDGQSPSDGSDGSRPIPTIQCKCQRLTEDRRRESQFREFPVSARRASQDRRLYGRTSVVVVGRIPLSGSPKWPEMRGRHAGSEPTVRSDNTPKKSLQTINIWGISPLYMLVHFNVLVF